MERELPQVRLRPVRTHILETVLPLAGLPVIRATCWHFRVIHILHILLCSVHTFKHLASAMGTEQYLARCWCAHGCFSWVRWFLLAYDLRRFGGGALLVLFSGGAKRLAGIAPRKSYWRRDDLAKGLATAGAVLHRQSDVALQEDLPRVMPKEKTYYLLHFHSLSWVRVGMA